MNRLFALAVTLIATGSDLVSAGLIDLPRTGQTNSYYAGDDGALRAGVPWPERRFTHHGNGTATDLLTGLMWVTNGNLMATRDAAFDTDGAAGDGMVTWEHALDYVAKLNAENYLGHADWRLPNILELVSLIDFGRTNLALPAGHPFSNINTQAFWSSTTRGAATGYALVVSFCGRINSIDPDGIPSFLFGCVDSELSKDGSNGTFGCLVVRSGVAGLIALPRTGQTLSCYPGDDGDLQQGVAWPCPRFADHGDGTVTDRLTGLMWTKDKVAELTWTNALGYIAGMNSGAQPSLGYHDWRLPNALEGASLFDLSQTGRKYFQMSLPEGHPFAADYFYGLTSTAWAGDPTRRVFALNRLGFLQLQEIGSYEVHPVRDDPRPLPGASIKVNVRWDARGLPDTVLRLSGPLSGPARTDERGMASFTCLPAGAYTITPESRSHRFEPAAVTLNLNENSGVTTEFTGILTNNFGWRQVAVNAPSPYYRALHAIGNEVWLASNNRVYHSPDVSTQPLRLVFQGQPQTRLYGMTGFVTNGLRHLWAVGDVSLGARTTNATGTNWTDMWLSGDNTFTCVSFVNPQLGFAAGLDWHLHRTTDGGSNWNDTGVRINIGAINALQFLNETNGFAATESLRETLDGGMTWPKSTPGGFRDVFALDSEHVWAAGPDSILVSGNRTGGFMTFQRVISPHGYSLSQVTFVNASEGWVGSIHGHLLHSFDGGHSWPEDLHLADDWIRDLFFSSPTNGWAITGDSLFHYGPLFEMAAPDSPRLSIALAGTNVVLSWPAAATNFNLTATPQLGAGAAWTAVTNPPSLLGTNRVVTNAVTGTSRFYRLQTPQ
ncbi:MAG: DUF1566 domain-containing protein [Verrucomicrobia bacterium]|nr:DUF1566 domain-containing protein [Verrucomicrobiota bacterium]